MQKQAQKEALSCGEAQQRKLTASQTLAAGVMMIIKVIACVRIEHIYYTAVKYSIRKTQNHCRQEKDKGQMKVPAMSALHVACSLYYNHQMRMIRLVHELGVSARAAEGQKKNSRLTRDLRGYSYKI